MKIIIQTIKKKGMLTGMLGLGLLLGVVGGSALHIAAANAETTTDTTVAAVATQPPPKGDFDPTEGGHTANGKTEELLTGEIAEKVKSASLAAVSGGTIQRVETDAEGATYEAHMTKSDGTQVTVKLDSNFKVTETETGGHGQNKAK